METFTDPKAFVPDAHFREQRRHTLRTVGDEPIDRPIVPLVDAFNRLPYCFTLQSCYGHFVCSGPDGPSAVDSLSADATRGEVEYRLAYLAVCIENSRRGHRLFEALNAVPTIDPQCVQFGCAEWFWKRRVNSFALQVMPDRFKHLDTTRVDLHEALLIQRVRDAFFDRLSALVDPGHPLPGQPER